MELLLSLKVVCTGVSHALDVGVQSENEIISYRQAVTLVRSHNHFSKECEIVLPVESLKIVYV